MEIKTKTNGSYLNWKAFAQKPFWKQNEETNNRLGENICKWCDEQEISLQNLEIVPDA